MILKSISTLLRASVSTKICLKHASFTPLPDYSKVVMPPVENRLLPQLDAVPTFPPDQRPFKYPKRIADMRGPEPIHNTLMFGQYGVIAISGGELKIEHINSIRDSVNSKISPNRMFAYWRIEAPWKSKVKRGISKRLGGGKANIHHYVTPVRAGRILFEVGGYIEFDEVYSMLAGIAHRLPCFAMPISTEIMNKLREMQKKEQEMNINPVTRDRVFSNNMAGSHKILDYWEVKWEGKYV